MVQTHTEFKVVVQGTSCFLGCLDIQEERNKSGRLLCQSWPVFPKYGDWRRQPARNGESSFQAGGYRPLGRSLNTAMCPGSRLCLQCDGGRCPCWREQLSKKLCVDAGSPSPGSSASWSFRASRLLGSRLPEPLCHWHSQQLRGSPSRFFPCGIFRCFLTF